MRRTVEYWCRGITLGPEVGSVEEVLAAVSRTEVS